MKVTRLETGLYRVDWRENGRRIRLKVAAGSKQEAITRALESASEGQSETPTDPTAARRSPSTRCHAKRAGSILASPQVPTLEDAFRRCELEHWRHMPGYRTVVTNIKAALEGLGPETRLDQVTSSSLRAWVSEMHRQGNSPSTINRKLATVSKLLAVACTEWQILDRVPLIPRQKQYDPPTRVLTESEETLLISLVPPEAGALFRFLLVTGLRLGEALALTPRDCIVENQLVTVKRSKSYKARSVPVSSKVWADVIEPRLTREKLFPYVTRNQVLRIWNRARNAMGLADDSGFSPHALRHTCATRLWERTGDIYLVSQWLGHSNVQVTQRYTHIHPSRLMAVRDLQENLE